VAAQGDRGEHQPRDGHEQHRRTGAERKGDVAAFGVRGEREVQSHGRGGEHDGDGHEREQAAEDRAPSHGATLRARELPLSHVELRELRRDLSQALARLGARGAAVVA
jgi:hypothetical protein